ncbi:MAG: hypothetical protein Kow0059_04880 [Candidatus Sumerlaeia bacterium]
MSDSAKWLMATAGALLIVWSGALGMPFAQDDFVFLAAVMPGGPGLGAVVNWRHGWFRPLSQGLVLGGLARVLPPEPVLFHAAALALYLAAAGALFFVVRRLSGSAGLAGLAAFLWGGRSAHFLAVAWVSAVQDVVMALLSFAALGAAVSGGGASAGAGRGKAPARAVLVTALALAALLSKETAVVLPVIVGAVLYVRSGGAVRAVVRRPEVLGAAGATLLWAVLRLVSGGLASQVGVQAEVEGVHRVAVNVVAWPLMFFDVNREFLRVAVLGAWPAGGVWLMAWAAAAGSLVLSLVGARLLAGRAEADGRRPGGVGCDRRLLVAAAVWGMAGALPPLLHTRAFYGYFMLLSDGGWCLMAAEGLRALWWRAGLEVSHRDRGRKARIVAAASLLAIGMLSFCSIRFQIEAPAGLFQRAVRTEAGLQRLKAAHPAFPPGAVVVIEDLSADSEADARLWRALGWGAALPVLYGDGAMRVFSAFQPLGEQAFPPGSRIERLSIKHFVNVTVRGTP